MRWRTFEPLRWSNPRGFTAEGGAADNHNPPSGVAGESLQGWIAVVEIPLNPHESGTPYKEQVHVRVRRPTVNLGGDFFWTATLRPRDDKPYPIKDDDESLKNFAEAILSELRNPAVRS
jgi:hypothetical protein